jgi:hypothetical protein
MSHGHGAPPEKHPVIEEPAKPFDADAHEQFLAVPVGDPRPVTAPV